MPLYSAYGLALDSELRLPLPARIGALPLAAVSVLRDDFAARAGAAVELPYDAGGAVYGPFGDGVMASVKGVCDFIITETEIRVGGGASEEEAGDLVARMALGFVLQLRSMLAFHGSAVCRDGKALMILGGRGAGKSTTAAGLARRGWDLLCDDCVAVGNGLELPRGACLARLLPDAYEALTRCDGRPEPDRDGKLRLGFEGALAEAPERAEARLECAFVVSASASDIVEASELRGYSKLGAVLPHLLSPRGIGDPGLRLERAAQAMGGTRMFMVARPSGRFALEELLDRIETISRGEAA